MKFNEILQFEKENMPEFQWKFEKFLFVFLVVLLGGALIALAMGLIIGFATNGVGIYYFIPEFVWLGAVTVVTVMLVFKARRVKSKLREYYYLKISTEFVDTDYEDAKQYLLDNEVISEYGFIIENDEVFEEPPQSVVPFDKVQIEFCPKIWGGKLFFGVVLNGQNGNAVELQLDNFLYNFLRYKFDVVVNSKLFDLFCNDKKKFVDMLVRYNSAAKMEKKLSRIKITT